MTVFCPHCGYNRVKVFSDVIRSKLEDYPDVEFRDLQLLCDHCDRTTSAVITRKV